MAGTFPRSYTAACLLVNREARIERHHRHTSLPQQCIDGWKVHTRHDQPPCKPTASIMERKALNACLTHRTWMRDVK
jgi:hypothetical protein